MSRVKEAVAEKDNSIFHSSGGVTENPCIAETQGRRREKTAYGGTSTCTYWLSSNELNTHTHTLQAAVWSGQSAAPPTKDPNEALTQAPRAVSEERRAAHPAVAEVLPAKAEPPNEANSPLEVPAHATGAL